MSPMPCIHLELNLWGYYRWSKISVNWSNHPVGVASGWLMVDMPMDGWHEYKMFTDAHRCASGLICRTLTHPYQTGSTMKYKISVTRGRTIEGKMWFTASTTIVIGDIVAGEVFKRKSQLGGSNSCRPGKRSKNDSARDNLTWSSHRTLLMRLMCLGRNEFANLSNLFSVTLNRDWDRLRYHRRHTEDGMNWEVLNFWHWIFDISKSVICIWQILIPVALVLGFRRWQHLWSSLHMVVSHSCCHSSQSRKRLFHRTTVGKTASALFLNVTISKMYPVALEMR